MLPATAFDDSHGAERVRVTLPGAPWSRSTKTPVGDSARWRARIGVARSRCRGSARSFRPLIGPSARFDGNGADGAAPQNISISSDSSSWARRVSNLRPLACEAVADFPAVTKTLELLAASMGQEPGFRLSHRARRATLECECRRVSLVGPPLSRSIERLAPLRLRAPRTRCRARQQALRRWREMR